MVGSRKAALSGASATPALAKVMMLRVRPTRQWVVLLSHVGRAAERGCLCLGMSPWRCVRARPACVAAGGGELPVAAQVPRALHEPGAPRRGRRTIRRNQQV